MNSNLTDTYKKEVSDILARIGDGLGKTVLEQLKPSIKSVSDEVNSIRQEVIILKKNIELSESSKSNLLSKVEQLNEKSSGLILNQVGKITEGINSSKNAVNSSIEKLTQTIAIIPKKIQEGTDLQNTLHLTSFENAESLGNTKNEILLKQLDSISERLKFIESDNRLELKLNQNVVYQNKLIKLIYFSIFVMIIVLVINLITYL